MSPDAAKTTPLVLVVDDDEAVRTALGFALELQGYDVEVCSSGEALIERELPGANTCLVIDERLRGMSGLATIGVLRSRGVDIPAILITSHPQPQLRTAALAAGVPIVEKPLLGDGLVSAIRSALAV
jgi:FixJ family two-component response regulator